MQKFEPPPLLRWVERSRRYRDDQGDWQWVDEKFLQYGMREINTGKVTWVDVEVQDE